MLSFGKEKCIFERVSIFIRRISYIIKHIETPGKEERRDADGYQPDFLSFRSSGADAVPDLDIDHA